MSEEKQTTYICDICGAKMKMFNPPKFPVSVGWIRIVRKKRRKDICFGCVAAIQKELEGIKTTECKPSALSSANQL